MSRVFGAGVVLLVLGWLGSFASSWGVWVDLLLMTYWLALTLGASVVTHGWAGLGAAWSGFDPADARAPRAAQAQALGTLRGTMWMSAVLVTLGGVVLVLADGRPTDSAMLGSALGQHALPLLYAAIADLLIVRPALTRATDPPTRMPTPTQP